MILEHYKSYNDQITTEPIKSMERFTNVIISHHKSFSILLEFVNLEMSFKMHTNSRKKESPFKSGFNCFKTTMGEFDLRIL